MKKNLINRVQNILIACMLSAACANAAGIGQVGADAYDWANYKGLDGKMFSLPDMRGKIVLLFNLQYNCGGCKANAPRVGQIARKYQGKNFQAIGTELNRGAYSSLVPNDQTFEAALKSIAKDVDFPIVIGIPDSQTVAATSGLKWTKYDAYRDVYFVIDQNGKIVSRVDGNRGNTMGEANYALLDSGISKAVASLTSTSIVSNQGLCLQACKRSDGFAIGLDIAGLSASGTVSLRIIDARGQIVRNLYGTVTGNHGEMIWNGMDSRGLSVPTGLYFIQAETGSASTSRALTITR